MKKADVVGVLLKVQGNYKPPVKNPSRSPNMVVIELSVPATTRH